MSRRLAIRAVMHLAASVALFALAVLAMLADLGIEIADEFHASRNENRLLGGKMSLPKNVKLTDVASIHRSYNARLAAVVGVNTAVARAELSDARQLADELVMSARGSL